MLVTLWGQRIKQVREVCHRVKVDFFSFSFLL